MDADKLAAYQTLYSCLETVAILGAPIAPFYMERLFLDLNAVTHFHKESSVHSTIMPDADESLIDKDLEERMELAQVSSSMVLALRRKAELKVRQPLAKIMIPVINPKIKEQLEKVQKLVLNEVNVKEIEYITDTEGLITKKIKPMFRTLGKKYGKQMKDISAAFTNFTQKEISEIEKSAGADKKGTYTMHLVNGDVVLESSDYEITSEDMPGWLVATEGALTVALDINVTENLKKEGVARELVNRIQNLRKDSGFEVTDRIYVTVENKKEIAESLEKFSDYVCSQTLAKKISLADEIAGSADIEWDESGTIKIKVEKINN